MVQFEFTNYVFPHFILLNDLYRAANLYNPLSRAIVYRYIYARKFKLRFHHDGCFDPVLASFLECGLVSGRFYVFRQGSPEPGGLVEEVGPG